MLAFYRLLTQLLRPILPLYLGYRAGRGKEDRARLNERRGISRVARPEGDVFWLHAASVGECISAMVLARALIDARPGASVVLTSGTVTSAETVARRIPEFGLSGQLIHQYVPLDCPAWGRRFLNHWRPQLGVMIEGDIWPNLLTEAHQNGIPLAMASAQISPRSLRFWHRYGRGIAAHVFGLFKVILTVDDEHATRFRSLPVQADAVMVGGSMKIAAPALPDIGGMGEAIERAANGRMVVALLSSHDGEESLFVDAMQNLDKDQYLAVIAPRHPARTSAILRLLDGHGLTARRRSTDAWPEPRDRFWIADRMGEMGGLIRAADTIVLGGGFEALGGHNPMEAAALGKGVISGRHVFKNRVAFSLLDDCGGVIFASTAASLADSIATLASSPSKRNQHDTGAANAFKAIAGQTDAAASRLLACIREAGR